MDKIKRIVATLMKYPEGLWLRRLAKESKVPSATVHYYLEGVLSPFIESLGAKNEDGKFFGVRVIRLRQGVYKQLETGLTIEKLVKTRTLYQEVE